MSADVERKARIRRVIERLLAAHFLSYPIGFLWACACMPAAIWIARDELLDLGPEDAITLGNAIVRKVAAPAIASIVLVHLAGVPWAFEREAKGPRRLWFVRACVVIAVLGVALGAGGWIWLHAI